jgi:predicted transcriptional regulator
MERYNIEQLQESNESVEKLTKELNDLKEDMIELQKAIKVNILPHPHPSSLLLSFYIYISIGFGIG